MRRNKTVSICRPHDHLHTIYQRMDKDQLELIRELSKVKGYKVNTEKQIVFLYTNNQTLKKYHFTMKKLKYLLYKFETIIIKISSSFFVEISKLILKLLKCKGPSICQIILKKKTKVNGLSLPNFKAYIKLQELGRLADSVG